MFEKENYIASKTPFFISKIVDFFVSNGKFLLPISVIKIWILV